MAKHSGFCCYDTSTDRRLGAVRRRLVAWLGLLLLAFNVLGAAILPARADSVSSSLAPSFDRIEVCTNAGIVVIDRNGNVIPSDGSAQGGKICPFCLPLGHSGATATEVVGLAVRPPPPTVLDGFSVEHTEFLPAEPFRSASPRAPTLLTR